MKRGLPRCSLVKNPPANAGDERETGSIPGSERSPGKQNGNSLQYPCLGNHMDRGAWQATVHGVTKSQTQMSNCACTQQEEERLSVTSKDSARKSHRLFAGHSPPNFLFSAVKGPFPCFGGNCTWLTMGTDPELQLSDDAK